MSASSPRTSLSPYAQEQGFAVPIPFEAIDLYATLVLIADAGARERMVVQLVPPGLVEL